MSQFGSIPIGKAMNKNIYKTYKGRGSSVQHQALSTGFISTLVEITFVLAENVPGDVTEWSPAGPIEMRFYHLLQNFKDHGLSVKFGFSETELMAYFWFETQDELTAAKLLI